MRDDVLGALASGQYEVAKAAIEALQTECQRLADLFEHAPDAYLVTDSAGVIQASNVAAGRLLDAEPHTLVGTSLRQVLSPRCRAAFDEQLAAALTQDQVANWVLQVQPQHEGTRAVVASVAIGHGADGAPTILRWLLRSSNLQNDAEGGQLASPMEANRRDALLHQVIDHAPIILFAIDRDGIVTFTDGQGLTLLSEALSQTVGQSAFDILPEGSVELNVVRGALRGESGAWVNEVPPYFDARMVPLRDAQGQIVGAVGVAIDITEQMRAQQALRERDQLLHQVVTHLPVTFSVIDASGIVTLVEGAAADAYGLPRDTIIGRSIFETFADLPSELSYIRRALDGAAVRWSGSYTGHDVEMMASPIRGVDGSIQGAVLLAIDVTNQVRAERALHETERRLREVVEYAPIVLFATDQHGVVTLSEGKGLELIGETPGQTVGQSIFDLWHNYPDELSYVRRALDGESVRWMRTSPPFFDSQLTPIRDTAGQVIGVLGISVDVTDRMRAETERQELERKFQETQKLESLGMLAGGIAHDFNNLLQSILGNVEGALADTMSMDLVPGDITGDPSREAFVRIRIITRRAADLTRQLLAYAGMGQVVVEPLDLNLVIDDALELLNVSIPKTASLHIQRGPQLPAIEGDVAQIRQVVLNLVMNGAEALGGQPGTVSVATEARTLTLAAAAAIDSDPPIIAGTYVMLSVSDTGQGMNTETLARIFEPFFTTKFIGRGLGLAAVRGIARSHSASIQVTSLLEHGTTFTIYFPASPTPALSLPTVAQSTTEVTAGIAPTAGRPARWKGSGTVLVVDDDLAVQDSAASNLRRIGFTTLSASNGRAALDVFQAHIDEVRCVLLDWMMPEMNGIATALALHQLRPDLPIIMMSGHNEAEALGGLPKEMLAGFLHKPFSLEQLRETLRQTLD